MIRDVNYSEVVQLLERARRDITDCICELVMDDGLQAIAREIKLKVIELQDTCRNLETEHEDAEPWDEERLAIHSDQNGILRI